MTYKNMMEIYKTMKKEQLLKELERLIKDLADERANSSAQRSLLNSNQVEAQNARNKQYAAENEAARLREVIQQLTLAIQTLTPA